MNTILELTATLSAALFSGASVYINLVEHPARMSSGTAFAVTEFGPSYRRALVLQVSLAVISFLTSLAAWLLNSALGWLFGGMLIIMVIPFTAIFMLPINNILLDSGLDKESDKAKTLLIRWGRLHAVRSYLSLGAVLIFLLSGMR